MCQLGKEITGNGITTGLYTNGWINEKKKLKEACGTRGILK